MSKARKNDRSDMREDECECDVGEDVVHHKNRGTNFTTPYKVRQSPRRTPCGISICGDPLPLM